MKYLLETQQRLLALYGQQVCTGKLPIPIASMRRNLISEEVRELNEAIYDMATFEDYTPEQRAHFLKEFADTLVVLFGTAAQLGFTDEELEEAYDIVHMDNLSKAYAREEDALVARDYYLNNKHGDYHVKEVPMPALRAAVTLKGDGELIVDPIGRSCYVVINEDGKTMKRYPAPATTAEERIWQYITKYNISKTPK